MHTHMTNDGKITIHHNSDWSGDVEIVAGNKMRPDRLRTIIDTPRRVTLAGAVVLSGDYDRPSDCPLTERELRRATALAVEVRFAVEIESAFESALDAVFRGRKIP